eukprot:TRINITY_DN8167_c0_g1_i3.p3 TRINITY_DN8167_c0_g1~~TRINITY_DN8167_c0_g1_i3.p3  ORF type:complete len:218 (+),score=35.49 TRINITY_DN8167_c0_g1_i3:1189-1842(+)
MGSCDLDSQPPPVSPPGSPAGGWCGREVVVGPLGSVRRLVAAHPALADLPWCDVYDSHCGAQGTVEDEELKDGTVLVRFPDGATAWYPSAALAAVRGPWRPAADSPGRAARAPGHPLAGFDAAGSPTHFPFGCTPSQSPIGRPAAPASAADMESDVASSAGARRGPSRAAEFYSDREGATTARSQASAAGDPGTVPPSPALGCAGGSPPTLTLGSPR